MVFSQFLLFNGITPLLLLCVVKQCDKKIHTSAAQGQMIFTRPIFTS